MKAWLKFVFFVFVIPVLVAGLPLSRRFMRRIMKMYPTTKNPYAALIETPLNGPLAYTATDGSRMYVDTDRLQEAPNTLWNVLRHEYAHTMGQTHDDDTPEMKYAATLDPQGGIVNDDYRI